MPFEEISLDIVKNFLHAAVLIDDEISWSEPQGSEAKEIEEDTEEDTDEYGAVVDEEVGAATPVESIIYADRIIETFSQMGIVCAPFTWKSDAVLTFPNSTDKADLLILDWKLEKDGAEKGSTACKLLKDRLVEDLKGTEKLRFITFYSSEDKGEILTKLSEVLSGVDGVSIERADNFLDVKSTQNSQNKELWRITYINKSLDETSLGNKLVSAYTEFVTGLLPTTVLAAITDIRNKAPEYLATFHKSLDLSIISHYSALKSQPSMFDTAEIQYREYIINLILSRISADLHHAETLKTVASRSTILEYLGHVESMTLACPTATEMLLSEKEQIIQLLSIEDSGEFIEKGIELFSIPNKKKRAWQEGRRPLSFYKDESLCDESMKDLSILDLFKRTRKEDKKQHVLKLGSVVGIAHQQDDTSFYVCIQPLCDSLRLFPDDNPHKFPFLKLQCVGADKNYNIVFRYGDDYKHCKVECKPKNIEMYSFDSSADSNEVRFDTNFQLDTIHPAGLICEWIGELEAVYAQEIVNQLAAQGSRVGNDKFEWLRLKTTP